MDLSTVLRRDGGPRELLDLVKQRYGRIRFSAADFAGRSPRNPLFQTAYLAVKHAGAKDWRSGLGLSLTHSGKYHYIQTHHIFPKALTQDYESSEVNEIANLAFISGGQNRAIGSKSPRPTFLRSCTTAASRRCWRRAYRLTQKCGRWRTSAPSLSTGARNLRGW